MNLSFLGAFNWTMFITAMTYVLFLFIIIGAVLKGLKRGLVRSSIRLGTLIVFIIVAGLISMPITKALMGIDVSVFGVTHVNAEGATVTAKYLPEVVKFLLFKIDGVEAAVSASPALEKMIEGLPYMIINFIVFYILIWVFRLISYIVYVIIEKFALKSSKVERAAKKQAKLEKKAAKKGQVVQAQNQVVLTVPKRHRLLGALVGAIQGLVLAFVLFFPLSTICGMVGDLTTSSSISAGVQAESENLNEKSGDLIRYYTNKLAGDDVIQYFNSYNDTAVAKIVAMGGLNYVTFDEITKIDVNGKEVKLRQEVYGLTNTFDELMDILNFGKDAEGWKDINFDGMNKLVDKLLDSNLFSSLIPELMPYALENYVYDMEMFNELPGSQIAKEELNDAMEYYTNNNFMALFKDDVDAIFAIVKNVFKSGLFDDIYSKNITSEKLLEYIKANNNELQNLVVDSIYNSKLIQVAGTLGLNYAGDLITTKLELSPALKQFDNSVFKAEERKGVEDIIEAVLECFDLMDELSDVKIEDMTDAQIEKIANLLTSLQNNTFKKYDENDNLVDRENTIVNASEQTVVNGGPFSNMYIALVDYYVKDYIENIAYRTADWHVVLNSVKQIASIKNGELPKLSDVMNILGLDENLSESAKDIASALDKISSGEELTKEDTANLLNNISDSIDNFDETKFNNVVDKVGQTLGKSDLSDKVNYETVVTEKNVATTVANLLLSEEGLTNENADETLNELASSDFILSQIADAGVTVDNNVAELEDKINALSASEQTKEDLKTIFGIKVG